MLFKRYASPMVLLDSMIKTHRFSEFVNEFIDITNEEFEDHTLWELWLNRVVDRDWNDFYKQAKTKKSENIPSENELLTTVKESVEMLSGFHLS